jgi:hypothetical protein
MKLSSPRNPATASSPAPMVFVNMLSQGI